MAIYDEGNGSSSYSRPATATPAGPKIGDKTYDADLGKWLVVDGFDDYGDPTYSYVSANTGGSGGSSGPDHFFDISPTDQYSMDRNNRLDARDAAREDRNAANDDRTFNYNVGRDAAADARNARLDAYGETRDARADFNSDRNYALNAADSQNRYNADMARLAVEKQNSDNNYAIGIANAQNDAERNHITQLWNEEQARIAMMEDETKMILGQQQNQTGQFNAETSRASEMGKLALDNNKFIADMARSPRDLFSLYFMQRGLAPDWDGMAAGNAPAQGAALAPSSVMNAYTPTTAPTTFGAVNQSRANVGKTNYTVQRFVPPPIAAGGGGGGAAPAFVAPVASAAPTQIQHSQPKNNALPVTPRASMPVAKAAPLNDGKGHTWDEAQQSWVNDSNGALNDGKGHSWDSGSQGWLNDSDGSVYMAEGGFTTAKDIVAGDDYGPDPSGDGAKPERIFNPTGAPLAIQPHPDNVAKANAMQKDMMFRPPNPASRPVNQAWDYTRRQDESNNQRWAQGKGRYAGMMMTDFGRRPNPAAFIPPPAPAVAPKQGQIGEAYQLGQGREQLHPERAAYQPGPYDELPGADYLDWAPRMAPTQPYNLDRLQFAGPRRFALGTQGEYEANGMGSAYMPSSTNSHITGEVPRRLQNLIDYGAPIPPSLVANATGQVAPTLNMGSALQQRGGGTGASLQTLRNQTKGETELYRGFVEGNNGISWADFTDWLAKPTEHLRSAQRAQG